MILVNTALPEQLKDVADCLHVVHELGKVIPIHTVPNTFTDPDEVFMDLYRAHYDPLKKRILHYIAALRTNPEDADDILQNVFKKLWENKNHLHEISSPVSYLFTMAKHEFLNSQRSLNRKKVTLQDYTYQLEHQANTTEEMILFKETASRITQAISELPARMKETLTLRIEGHKIMKIARRMGISQSTVKNQLQVVVKKMQARLQDEAVY